MTAVVYSPPDERWNPPILVLPAIVVGLVVPAAMASYTIVRKQTRMCLVCEATVAA